MEEQLNRVMTSSTSAFHLRPFYKFQPHKYTIEELKALGFKVKEGYTSSWTLDEEKAVSEFMQDILQNPESLQYYDYFMYISRKILDGSKTRNEVKRYLTQFLKKKQDE
jgi:uncharacterized protein YggL (DUF469 family)